MPPSFLPLDQGWRAEPNAPSPRVRVIGSVLTLSFLLDRSASRAEEGEVGSILFAGCSRWRWDDTNEEDWLAGSGRYRASAPEWGRFYELVGDDPDRDRVAWHPLPLDSAGDRHFLLYLRDETFECLADRWSFVRGLKRAPGDVDPLSGP